MSNMNGMDIVLILAGAYLIYLGIKIFRDHAGESSSMLFTLLFVVIGAVFCGLGILRILRRK